MPRTRTCTAALAAAALMVAGFALGQNADKNTAAPTKNDYRLRVVEPAEGAKITGSSLQVVVDLRTFPEVGGETENSDSMPAPRVDVFLDNDNKGTLREGQNVMTLDNISPGSHQIVVLALNLSGEVIDRKEINFTTEAGTSVAQSSVETHRAPAPAEAPAPAPREEPAPEPPSTRMSVPPPAPPPAPAVSREETTTAQMQMETLPETASSTPLLAAAGLGLLVTGLALRRRA